MAVPTFYSKLSARQKVQLTQGCLHPLSLFLFVCLFVFLFFVCLFLVLVFGVDI